jgi:hypothetical protein
VDDGILRDAAADVGESDRSSVFAVKRPYHTGGRDHGWPNQRSMWGRIWVPSPSVKRPAREQLEVVRQVWAAHRLSREGDRDRRRQLDARRRLGCHGERQEGIGFEICVRGLRSGLR